MDIGKWKIIFIAVVVFGILLNPYVAGWLSALIILQYLYAGLRKQSFNYKLAVALFSIIPLIDLSAFVLGFYAGITFLN